VARVLVIYHRAPQSKWLLTYVHNLYSLGRLAGHECYYLNAARGHVPRYLEQLDPDLIVFHYTLLLLRQSPQEWARILRLIGFARSSACVKVLVAQDEQVRMDLLNSFVNDFGVTHVFSPAPPAAWHRVYKDVDFDRVKFHSILTGYVDEATARRIGRRLERAAVRPIDIGYRSWYTAPFYGRHGQLKQEIGRVFKERAPAFGLVTDISNTEKDALFGTRWFDFLMRCKYTIGVEGGCSVYDWDGAIAARTREYAAASPGAAFEEIAASCFSGLDGDFECSLISPRHIEAAMTKTCQVLVEGAYAGVLEPGLHYIEVKRDFSNLDQVLEQIQQDQVRTGITERAYADVVLSGRYSYGRFAETVMRESLRETAQAVSRQRSARLRLAWNRSDEQLLRLWSIVARVGGLVRSAVRHCASMLLGEERLRRFLARVRGA
jgi:hypothetical protein